MSPPMSETLLPTQQPRESPHEVSSPSFSGLRSGYQSSSSSASESDALVRREAYPFPVQTRRSPSSIHSRTSSAHDSAEDSLLEEVADESWSRSAPRGQSWLRKVVQWYKPIYDYKTPGLTSSQRRRARYCGGKFVTWQFVLLHLVLAGVVMAAVLIPIVYFIVVPHIIQSKVSAIDTSTLSISKLDVSAWTTDGLNFGFGTELPAQLFLPLHVKLGAMTAVIGDKDDFGDGWAEAQIPELAVSINQIMKVDLEGKLVVKNVDGLQALIRKISSPKGMQGMAIRAKFKATITVWGINWYKNLPLYKDIEMPALSPTLSGLYGALPSALRARNLNQQIRHQFLTQELVTFPNTTLPDIAIQDIDITMTDAGVSLDLAVAFENPTIVTVALPDMALGVSVQNRTIANVGIRNVTLTTGVNQMKMGVDIGFVASESETMGKVIGAMLAYLTGSETSEDFNPDVVGPITMRGVEFIGNVTEPLVLSIPVEDALRAFHVDKLKGLLTLGGVQSIISSLQFSGQVMSEDVRAAISVSLPKLIPLPPIAFKYLTSLNVQSALSVVVQPILIVTGDDSMVVSTGVVVTPVNTDAAATSLATAINPILHSDPQSSAVSVTDLSFAQPSAGTAFPTDSQAGFAWASTLLNSSTSAAANYIWANTLFKPTILPVPLPGICISCMVSSLTRNGTTLPLFIRSMIVNQLTDAPGFSANGQLGINLPMSSSANIQMNAGYVGLSVGVGALNVPLIDLQMPTGLNFTPIANANNTALNIDTRLVLARDPRLPDVLQSFVNGFVDPAAPTDASTSITVTGIGFGLSLASHFTTFSKVVVSIDAHEFRDVVETLGSAVMKQVFAEKAVELTNVGLDVVTGTKVNVGISAQVMNPVPLAINVGSVALDVALDATRLTSILTAPIALTTGTGALHLDVAANLATGANGLSTLLAAFAADVMANRVPASTLVFTGLVMTPPGTNSTIAVIDQFSGLNIRVPPAMLHQLLGADSPIDFSDLLGGKGNLISGFGIGLSRASVNTLPQASLAIAAGLQITNPLPISVNIPYAEVALTFDGLDFVSVVVSNISLSALATAPLSPTASLQFPATPGIEDKVAAFVNAFVDGRIMDGVGIKSIVFGGSPQDRNDLASLVTLDVTSFTHDLSTTSLMTAIVGAILGKSIKFPLGAADFISLISSSVQGTIKLDTQPNKAISLGLDGVKLALPFTIDANIGTFALVASVTGNSFLNVAIDDGIQIKSSQIDALAPLVQFTDQSGAQDQIAAIGRWVFDGTATDASLDVAGIVLGVSATDRITSFDRVRVSIPVSSVLVGNEDMSGVVKALAPAITRLDLAAAAGNALALSAGVTIESPLQIAAHIGFAGVDVALDQNPLVDLTLPDLAIVATNGSSNLAVATRLSFKDTDGTRKAVGSLVDTIMNGGDDEPLINVGSLLFGNSQTDVITAFSRLSVPISVRNVLVSLGVSVPLDYAQAGHLLSLAIDAATVDVQTGKSMAVDLAANIAILPFPTTLSFPHVGARVDVDENPLLDVQLPDGLNLAAGTPATDIKASVLFVDTGATQSSIAKLVEAFLNSPTLDSSIGLSRLQIGVSLTDRLTLLDDVHVELDMDRLCKTMGVSIPMDITEFLGSTSPSLGTVIVRTAPLQTLQVTASADLTVPLPFPVTLNVGYVAMDAQLGYRRNAMHPLADISLPKGLALQRSSFASSFSAVLRFKDQDATRSDVATIVDGLCQSGLQDGWLGVQGLVIGASSTDRITAFDKVIIELSLVRLLTQMHIASPIDLANIANRLNASISDLAVATAPAATLGVKATAGFVLPLPFAVDFQTAYFNTRTLVNDVPLAMVDIPDIKLAASEGQRAALALSIDVKFFNDGNAKAEVAKVINNVLHTAKADGVVGVDTILFGASDSPNDWIQILSKASITLPVDSLLPSMGVKLPLNLNGLPSMLNTTVDGTVQLRTLPASRMGVNATASFSLPFSISLSMGYVGLRVNVDDSDLLSVALPGLRIDSVVGGRNTLSVDAAVTFEQGSGIQDRVADLVAGYLKGVMSGTVGIDQLVFGVSSTDVIDVISEADLSLPIATLLSADTSGPVDLGSIAASYLESALSGNATGGHGMSIRHAGIAAEAGSRLRVTAAVFVPLALPFSVELDLGYVGVKDIDVNDVRIMSVDIDGLAYRSSNAAIDASVAVASGKQVQDVLRNIVEGDKNGSFSGTLGIAGLAFGYSRTDVIEVFSKAQLLLSIAPIGKVLSHYITQTLNSFLSGVPTTGAIEASPSSDFRINLGTNGSLSLSNIAVAFQPSSVIACKVDGSLQLPFDITASLPFLDVAIGLDAEPVVQIAISGLEVAEGTNVLKLETDLIVQEGATVQNKVAAVAQAIFANAGSPLPGSLSISGLRLGVSATDSIDALSEIIFSLPLEKLARPFLSSNSNSDNSSTGWVTEVKIDHLGVRAVEKQTLALDVSAGFTSHFPLSLTGLGYIAVTVGIDSVDLLNVEIPGLTLQAGANSVDLRLDVAFLSSDAVSTAIAKLVNDIYTLGWGNSPETLALAGLAIGHSAEDHISAFSKARIGFASSRILSAANIDAALAFVPITRGDFTETGMFSRVSIPSAHLRFDEEERLEVVGQVSLSGISMDAAIVFPYLSANLAIDGNHLAAVELTELFISQTGQDSLLVHFTIALQFPTGDISGIQTAFSNLVTDMQHPTGAIRGTLQMQDLTFGVSKDDSINVLAKCEGGLALQQIGVAGANLFNNMLKSIALELVDVAPASATAIDAQVIARLDPGLPDILAAIPFVYLEVLLDDKVLITPEATDVSVSPSGQVLARANIEFVPNTAGIQALGSIAGNLIFRRPQTVTNSVTITGLLFGRTRETATRLVATSVIDFDLPWFIDVLTEYINRPENKLDLTDIHGTVVPEGVFVTATAKPLPPLAPFRSRPGASAMASVIFKGQNAVDLIFTKVALTPGQPIQFELMVKTVEPAIFAAADVILPQLLEWVSFTQGVQLGSLALTLGDPTSPSINFQALNQALLQPPDLYMFEPIFVKPELVNPLTQGLGLDIHLGMPNMGCLHVDLGILGVRITDRGTTEIGKASTPDGLVLKNVAEGGGDPRVNDFRLAVRLDLDFNPIKVWDSIVDLLHGGANYQLDFFATTTGGTAVPWLTNVLAHVPDYLKGNLLPIIVGLLDHIKIKLGPFTITPPPIFHELAEDILAKLPTNRVVIVDGVMPSGFAPIAPANGTGSVTMATANNVTSVLSLSTSTLTSSSLTTTSSVVVTSATLTSTALSTSVPAMITSLLPTETSSISSISVSSSFSSVSSSSTIRVSSPILPASAPAA
ncbi:hypothetical protein HKX48_005132 [Thoreauomyces humboldtii]|nr:hypothetical protein HKX48_005132 [Thoreauomyces humboldtii]